MNAVILVTVNAATGNFDMYGTIIFAFKGERWTVLSYDVFYCLVL